MFYAEIPLYGSLLNLILSLLPSVINMEKQCIMSYIKYGVSAVFFLLFFSFVPESFCAENNYAGKRWGFSHLVATSATDFAWSQDGRHLCFRVVENDFSYIYKIRDVWKVVSGKTMPGKLKLDLMYQIKSPVSDFVFSPNLMQAAYCISEGGGYSLYVVNFSANKSKRLTYGMAPKWSPKGDKLAFYFMGAKKLYGIATINPDGTNLKILSELGDWGPVWSPDGKSIAFLSARNYNKGTTDYSNIYVIRQEPYSIMQVTRDKNVFQKNLSWSPIGKKIVYETFRGVELVDTASMSRKLLVSKGDYPASHVFSPFFSPDARWVFYRNEKGMGIYQHNTQEEVVIGGSSPWFSPVLDPSGIKIVFSVSAAKEKGIWVVEAFNY